MTCLIATAVSGCIPAPAPIAPAHARPNQGATIGADSSHRPQFPNSTINFSGPKEELQDRCDQLANQTPGIEELRLKKDGAIESRQWTLVAHDTAPRWAIVLAKNGARDGWEPKPGVAKLKFTPPLEPQLANRASKFLAYAPMQGETFDEQNKMATVNEVFGDAQGSFSWRGRAYGYALTPQLPCYPFLQ